MAKSTTQAIRDFWSAHWKTIVIVLLIAAFIFQPQRSPIVPFSGMMEEAQFMMDYDSAATRSYAPSPMMDSAKIAGGVMMPPVYYDGGIAPQEAERKITRSGNVGVEVAYGSIDGVTAQVKQRITSIGGFIENSNEWTNTIREKDYRTSSMSIRLPTEHYDATIDYLRSLGKITSLSVNLQDETKQYVDVKAYVQSYEAEKAKLMQLYDQAEKLEDLISLQSRITEVQRQIDMYNNQLKNIDERVDYSTLYVTIEEKRPLSDSTTTFSTFKELITRLLKSVNGIIVFIFWVAPYALAIWLIYAIAKRFGKQDRK